MVDIKDNPIIEEDDLYYEPRVRINSTGSSISSSSDYITGDADDSSDSKETVPASLKSVEAMLSIIEV